MVIARCGCRRKPRCAIAGQVASCDARGGGERPGQGVVAPTPAPRPEFPQFLADVRSRALAKMRRRCSLDASRDGSAA